jgi:hypothetical protein
MSGGLLIFYNKNKKLACLIAFAILINFIYFLAAYYVHFPKISSDNFQYGYKQAWEYIKPIVNDYQKVVIEPRFGINGQFIGLPRLYFGYFGAFNSIDMLSRNDELSQIGKYWINNVDWNKEIISENTLYIVSISNPTIGQAANELELMTEINKTDGRPQFLIYKTK